jgi:DNA-binding NtrC family response regulator
LSISLNVLIVEDSEDDALLLVRDLRHGGYDVAFERVETVETMIDALDRRIWDLVISDYTMPHLRGADALKLVRERDPDIPFIFLSGTIGEETAVTAMKHGANDYVFKSNIKRLLPAIERELREAQMRREHRKADKALWESEERYRTLAEAAQDTIFILNRDGYYRYINTYGALAYGQRPEQIIGRSIEDIFPASVVEPEDS